MSEKTTPGASASDVADEEIRMDDESHTTQTDEEITADDSAEETHTDLTGDESAADEAADDNDADDTAAAEATPVDEEDENAKWLRNRGIDPKDPDAIKKAAEYARETERKFHQSRQEEAASRRSVQDAIAEDESIQEHMPDNDDSRVARLERNLAEERFYRTHPEAVGHEDEIIATAKKYPKLAADFDLGALWDLTQAQNTAQLVAEAEERGRKQAAEEQQRKSTARVPSGNASAGGKTPKKDPLIEGFDSEL